MRTKAITVIAVGVSQIALESKALRLQKLIKLCQKGVPRKQYKSIDSFVLTVDKNFIKANIASGTRGGRVPQWTWAWSYRRVLSLH